MEKKTLLPAVSHLKAELYVTMSQRDMECILFEILKENVIGCERIFNQINSVKKMSSSFSDGHVSSCPASCNSTLYFQSLAMSVVSAKINTT